MVFPSLRHLGKVALIATLLAAAGFLLTPTTGWFDNGALDAALLLGLGALLGGTLAAIQRARVGDESLHTLFVGNLAFKATEEELRDLFTPFGAVRNTRIMRDRKTRRPRGYGFVELSGDAARKAVRALDGKEFHGRKLRVKEGNRKDEDGGE